MHELNERTLETARRPMVGVAATLAFGVALAIVTASCSGSAASPAASAAATPAAATPAASQAAGDVCADVAALQTSIDDLKALDVTQTGTDGLQAAIDKVKTGAFALKASAGSKIGPAVDALLASLDGLKTAIQGVGPSPAAGAAADAIRASIAEVGTAATAVGTAIKEGPCPS